MGMGKRSMGRHDNKLMYRVGNKTGGGLGCLFMTCPRGAGPRYRGPRGLLGQSWADLPGVFVIQGWSAQNSLSDKVENWGRRYKKGSGRSSNRQMRWGIPRRDPLGGGRRKSGGSVGHRAISPQRFWPFQGSVETWTSGAFIRNYHAKNLV
jgi:hypothetical protein